MTKKEKNAKAPRKPDVGGQAVLEGVMMKSPNAIAIAVRKPDGSICVKCDPYVGPEKKHPWMKLPIVRGVVNMVLMLAMGMSTLEESTRMLGVEEEEPSKFEKWLAKKLGKSIDKIVIGTAIVLAVCLSVFLFVAIPSFFASLVNKKVSSLLVVNLVSGAIRIFILMAYIWACGLIPDMRRTFQYHGAEHKTVYCNEADLPLTPQNAKQFSTLHPRCGTSFLLITMILAILVGAVADQLLHLLFGIERLSFAARLLRSIILLPLLAGISYEALKALAHSENKLVRALRWPGLMLQHLTTREPDESQLEVAIASMNAALAGKKLAPTVVSAAKEEAPGEDAAVETAAVETAAVETAAVKDAADKEAREEAAQE
ncbi:MAG TPA: DUF1385 domain-containing protein [Candidatus Aphodomonas merdavium]|nr:DUF1385 domain-containing protein [Candidatus Aphodomonas merdavium]